MYMSWEARIDKVSEADLFVFDTTLSSPAFLRYLTVFGEYRTQPFIFRQEHTARTLLAVDLEGVREWEIIFFMRSYFTTAPDWDWTFKAK